MRSKLLIIMAALLGTVGASAQGVPSYTPVECAYALPETLTAHATVTCGLVTAPVDPADPDGATHQLSVVKVSAAAKPLPDPIVFLSGGPGVALDAYWPAVEAMLDAGLLEQSQRDLLLFDQRGVGRSTPSLSCVVEASAAQLLPTMDANRTCSARLADEGIELTRYTTVNNAEDVDAIRRAMGYAQFNIYGHSYGSRLALALMRYAPEGVRSVMLEGVFPPNARFIALPKYVEGALARVFDACADDPACSAAYGDLDALFSETYLRVKARPIFGGFDHNTLVRSLYYLMQGSRADEPSIIPAFILAVKNADRTIMERAYALIDGEIPPSGTISEGMQTLINCADEAPFLSEAELAKFNDGVRVEIMEVFSGSVRAQFLEQCQNWPRVELGSEHYKGVVSDIPTLILNGTFDQVTALENAQLAADSLTRVTLIPFPGYGHWPHGRGNPCAIAIYSLFLTDPIRPVDSSCVATTPITFLLP
ncbi:MAG: alpha/beta fold hydrolase [Chloroflexi bacterium]|nr:alpha/beta fold hydrolase [Chloroflexota bacterium]